MEITLAAIRALPAEVTKQKALSLLTKAIRRETPERAIAEAEYRLTCSAVIYSRTRREVWLIGDCQCRFGGRTYTHPKPVDTILTQIRCDVVRYFLDHGRTVDDIRHNDPGRAYILSTLREQCNFQNDTNPYNPYSYPVLDGMPIDPQRVPTLAVADSKELILASDGYPVLFDTLAETETHLHTLLQRDPLCIRENPTTKCLVAGNCSFDDRTYLRLMLD